MRAWRADHHESKMPEDRLTTRGGPTVSESYLYSNELRMPSERCPSKCKAASDHNFWGVSRFGDEMDCVERF
jgi:hypothetical protein